MFNHKAMPPTITCRSERLRVLLIGPNPTAVSGISTHLDQLLRSRLAVQFQLSYFVIGSAGKHEHLLARFIRLLISPTGLWKTIRKVRPHIVHINTSLLHTSFWRDTLYVVVSKVRGTRVILQIHGGSFSTFCDRSRFLRYVLALTLKYMDAVVVLSEREQVGCAQFHVRALATIPNAINLDEYQDLQPKKYWSLPNYRIAYIGRLANDKGIYETIEAMAILAQEGITNVTFCIAGEGDEKNRLYEQATKLGVKDRVDFVGPVFGRDKVNFWQRADLFLLPTYCPEGLPYALLESLASGTPVITTRAGAIAEAMNNGTEGVFVEPRSAVAVAVALRTLIRDPHRLEQMSLACRLRAQRYYGIERLVDQFYGLYMAVMQQAGGLVVENNQAGGKRPPACDRMKRITSRR